MTRTFGASRAIKHANTRAPTLALHAGVLAAGLALAGSAAADPADYVFVPYADAGARYVSYAAGVERDRDDTRETQQSLGLAWSPGARWYVSGYGAWASEDHAHYTLDEWSLLGHVQLADPGAWPVDVGVLCEASRPHDRDEGTIALTCGPTLQFDTERLQVNINPMLGKQAGTGAAEPATLGYQWQVKSLWRPGVELGAQGFGEMGTWNHWASASQQSHTLGPAIFAKWPGHGLSLDAAWLVGVGEGSPRDVLRLRMQREF